MDSSRTMSFFDHLDELRARFIRCLMVFMVGFVLCYLLSDHILAVLRRPLFEVMPPDQRKLYYTGLFENFLTHLKVSGYASLVFFSPYYFYQVWAFVSPGLYQKEKKLVVPFVSAATVFFLLGASFAYFLLFPVGFRYFLNYGAASDVPLLTIDSYYTLCLRLLLLFGAAFELPVLITLLSLMGLVGPDTLRQHRKTALIIITLIAAFVAPPDAVSMLMLMSPLFLMYEGSIWVAQWIVRKREASSKAVSV